jgi:hypothetical protein
MTSNSYIQYTIKGHGFIPINMPKENRFCMDDAYVKTANRQLVRWRIFRWFRFIALKA